MDEWEDWGVSGELRSVEQQHTEISFISLTEITKLVRLQRHHS